MSNVSKMNDFNNKKLYGITEAMKKQALEEFSSERICDTPEKTKYVLESDDYVDDEKPEGPFTCMKCGKEYEKLKEVDDV